ncbi:MAG: carbohydrate kinase family protein [Bacteroidota bacterium]
MEKYINEAIAALQADQKEIKVFVALDGYIDKIQKVVARTPASNEREYFHSLATFGQQIQQSAGRSSQMEIVSEVVKFGGNAPIMAEALAALGIPNYCIGTFGEAAIDSVFQAMHDDVELVSLGDAATTNALEFDDGKLMLSEVVAFKKIDWAFLKSKVGLDRLTKWIQEVDLIALVDWMNLPHATVIWNGILEEIIIPNQLKTPIFFDLCDPKKKTDEQILEVLQLISRYNEYTSATLGLNENEAIQIYDGLKRANGETQIQTELMDKCQYIFQAMNLDTLVVHPINGCYLIQRHQAIYVPGKVVTKPKISTGGGDNFNAGFCYGLLYDLSSEAAMLIGIATSGAYVQNGQSPSKDQLIDYLKTFRI